MNHDLVGMNIGMHLKSMRWNENLIMLSMKWKTWLVCLVMVWH